MLSSEHNYKLLSAEKNTAAILGKSNLFVSGAGTGDKK